jgi:hypothetical protein
MPPIRRLPRLFFYATVILHQNPVQPNKRAAIRGQNEGVFHRSAICNAIAMQVRTKLRLAFSGGFPEAYGGFSTGWPS